MGLTPQKVCIEFFSPDNKPGQLLTKQCTTALTGLDKKSVEGFLHKDEPLPKSGERVTVN